MEIGKKKVGKTTRPFRYDLNPIPYDYTMEVTNRFKGLDLIDRVPEILWTEVCDIVQEAGIKTSPKKKKCQKEKWLSEEDLQIAEKRKNVNGEREKERYAHLCMKYSLGISNFLEEISSLSHSIVSLYFFALITEEGFLISPCYSLELCIQMHFHYVR